MKTMQNQISSLSRITTKVLTTGIISGVGGGIVFAVWGVLVAFVLDPLLQIHQLPILLQIAAIVHSSSNIVGMLLHLIISAILGSTFMLGITIWPRFQRHLIVSATTYGIFWWFFGTLTMLPILDGLALRWHEALLPVNLLALVGHAIFGLTLGVIVQRLIYR